MEDLDTSGSLRMCVVSITGVVVDYTNSTGLLGARLATPHPLSGMGGIRVGNVNKLPYR